MTPGSRLAVIAAGFAFCLLFAGATLASIGDRGFDALTVLSLVIVGLILVGLVGALREPPGR